jgi:hypothetical protein
MKVAAWQTPERSPEMNRAPGATGALFDADEADRIGNQAAHL